VNVNRETAQGAVVYRISGDINAATAPNLDSALAIDEGSSRVVLDMRQVTYVSSAGLRVIVQAAKRAKSCKGGVAVFGLDALVKEVFDAAGLGSIIPIASDEAEARSKLGA
jgi:anti-sigma B factor antagonist